MAISLEELALGALEGSAGPWTLAVGAGAVAVALAAGSARPLRRMASTGAFVAQRRGQLNLTGWLGGVRQGWRDLVAEARAEYEASRRRTVERAPVPVPGVVVVAPIAAPVAPPSPPVVEPVAEVPAPAPEPVAEASAPVTEPVAEASAPVTEPVAEAPAPVVEPASEVPAPAATAPDHDSPPTKRDQRGRFVRRPSSANGSRSE